MSDIDYTKHKDKRVNNPTIENRGFFAKEEQAPYDAMYPRDPSLDPQLVWKGKDEQDREDLKVPTVPIYIQEKISPAAIIADLKRHAPSPPTPSPARGEGAQPTLFFDDFNHMELEEGEDKFSKEVEFYEHEKNWTNRMILGDSLLVMNSLAEKEGLKGKVQCIYIDPPYGIKFGSNWQVSTRKRDVKDGKFEDAAREPEVVRAFRDTWAKGIHSYLSYLRDRLQVAHDLLTETGSIFVQIGDENVHLVRCLLDEVFGSENFVGQIAFAKTSGYATNFLTGVCDYILWYGKDISLTKYRQLYAAKVAGETGAAKYNRIELPNGVRRLLTKDERSGYSDVPAGSRYWVDDNLTSQGNPYLTFEVDGKSYGGTYKTTLSGLTKLHIASRIYVAEGSIRFVRFVDDFPAVPYNATWMDIGGVQSRTDPKIYVVQTATEAIKRCILMATDPGDLVLDPTCGSGTTAYVAEQWGRRWITIDTSRVALQLARTRLMAAKFPYYLLSDSKEGVAQEAKLTGTMPPAYDTSGDVRKGFVYKRVPHVTLKSIANNPDIKEGMTRQEIDAAIARHADTELLFDQPYEDKKRLRVTGPFTVESLSPHRVMPSDAEVPESEEAGKRDASEDFVAMTLENLRKAGVQNTKKGEKLVFDDLQPHAGRWIQARGSYTTAEGETKTVAVSVGPEYGAVSPLQIKEAAKEAVKGLGHDILVVCGYAFDPHVNEEAKAIGQLTVLPTRMNADLLMADDLLKKTGAG
ncbi:MAG TPA: site-specific DNA-methyltransferase, partial [Fimbriimonadaceae bacterium]|nr:site-specific DNA-methyltransferase [Fimbriimonadaceae bacterium]